MKIHHPLHMSAITQRGFIFVFFCLFFPNCLFGQGWTKVYNLENEDLCHTVLTLPDDKFAFIGSKIVGTDASGDTIWVSDLPASINIIGGAGNRKAIAVDNGIVIIGQGDQDEIVLAKYAFDGSLEWDSIYTDVPYSNNYMQLASTNSGGFMIASSYHDPVDDFFKIGMLEAAADGSEIGRYGFGNYPTNNDLRIAAFESLSNNYFAFGGMLGPAPYLVVADENGIFQWEKFPASNSTFGETTSIVESSDNQIVLAGQATNSSGFSEFYFFAAKYDLFGNETWSQTYEDRLEAFVADLIVSNQGGYLIVGRQELGSSNTDGLLLKVDDSGLEEWYRRYTAFLDDEFPKSAKNTIDGGYIIGGNSEGGIPGNSSDIFAWRMDAFGNIFPANIVGKVFIEEGVPNCEFDTGEAGLAGWVVKANRAGSNINFYGVTDLDGNYSIEVDTGSYEVSISLPYYWTTDSDCTPLLGSAMPGDTLVAMLPIYPEAICPLMTVDISTPFLRLCREGYYVIQYCNQGTSNTAGVIVEITLPPELIYIDATATLISQTGQTLLFDVGDVALNECGKFRLFFDMECDPILYGQTLCTEAHIFPDTICNNTWEGPLIELSATCENDSVRFHIMNVGADMTEALHSIIVVDNIILMPVQFQLNQFQTISLDTFDQSGTTYHMIAGQAFDLPMLLGNSLATVSIEGCNGNPPNGNFNQIPEDDGEPWLSIDCQEVISSYDPNDKNASPTGWADELGFDTNLIDNQTDIEYHIRFQNTGTDTAFNIVIVDTLSQWLDPGTIQPGASSHPYIFELNRSNEVSFLFPNILLPDSTVNEPESHGFIKFRISQKKDNLPGTKISNKAAIYFDYNDSVITNYICHFIKDDWIQIIIPPSGPNKTNSPLLPKISVNLFPNPFSDKATLELQGWNGSEANLLLFDAFGNEIKKQKLINNSTEIHKNDLSPGIYFFKIHNERHDLISGKLIIN